MAGDEYTIYAVKSIQPLEDVSGSHIPKIYEELKKGRARFGWSDADLRQVKNNLDAKGWKELSDGEKDVWSHASFELGVKSRDYLVYINMPEYGKCSVVRIKGDYEFEEISEIGFNHVLPCEFIATFDRNGAIVDPYLSKRLKLQGAWYRIYARSEFEELLDNLKKGEKGKTAKERLKQKINSRLLEIVEQIYRNFLDKKLEGFLSEVFQSMPNLRVRKGPDVNGADLEMEFETGLEIIGIQRTEKMHCTSKVLLGNYGL